ncbi:hypothetical protein JW930_02235 [Candidatus Woesearchaeota archaeon]|nr:hypothetical protein [Candidatus Woesearchaeota archaeon]
MEEVARKALMYAVFFIVGLLLVISGLPEFVHEQSFELTRAVLSSVQLAYVRDLKPTIGFIGQLIMASILLLLPGCVIGGLWFGKLGYEILFGYLKATALFALPLFVNKVIALLCLALCIYGFYEQYKIINKIPVFMAPKQEDKEMLKFI